MFNNFYPMIQRIQSVYLLLVMVCQGILFATSLATFSSYENSYYLGLTGLYKLSSAGEELLFNSYALMAFNILIIVYSAVVIFSFKNRKKQVRLAGFNIIMLCGFILLMFFGFDNAKSFLNISSTAQTAELSTTYGIGMMLPLLSLIFCLLAIRGIRKDEELVRSADRIR